MGDAADGDGKGHYKSTAEIQSLVERFESCVLEPDDVTHAAHIAISAWYLSRLSASEGARRIRESLLRFVEHHDLKVYNETITLFWIRLVSRSLESIDRGRSTEDLANDLIERCGDSKIIFDYYSRERLLSKEAQAEWVEPDLKPLDF
jgi:hypothetical protein